MNAPYFFRNAKANDPETPQGGWTFESGARSYEQDEIARLIAEKTLEDAYLDSDPPPERYGWMAVLVVACTILAVASITWRVYNPPASAGWVAK